MGQSDQIMDEFRKDDEGNIIGCPSCGARSIRKDGFSYYAKSKKQVWRCLACNKKTLTPTIVEPSPFTVSERDPEFMPVEDIIEFRKKQYSQKLKSKETKKLVDIAINID